MSEEVKIATAKEYRKAMTKVIRLPSGFHFRIRKMPPQAMAKLMDVYGEVLPRGRRELTPEEREQLREIGRRKFAEILKVVIPSSVVEPKIVEKVTTEDELSLDDLSSDDLFALLDEITAFSGLTAEAAEERKTFRKESSG